MSEAAKMSREGMGERTVGNLRVRVWQSKICRRIESATASCTIKELIGFDPHVSFQRFAVGAKLQDLRITVKRRNDPKFCVFCQP